MVCPCWKAEGAAALASKQSVITTVYWKQLSAGIGFSNLFVPSMGIIFSGMVEMYWFLELFGGQLVVFWGLLNQGLRDAWTQINCRIGETGQQSQFFLPQDYLFPKVSTK